MMVLEWCEWNWLRSQLEMPAGLNNLGNTCYMNATLQCLRSVPELRDAIKKYDTLITSVVCLHYLTLEANHLLALIMMLMCLCWFHFCCLTFAAGFMQNLWKQLCGVNWCLKTNWENQPVLEVGETALWFVRGFVDNLAVCWSIWSTEAWNVTNQHHHWTDLCELQRMSRIVKECYALLVVHARNDWHKLACCVICLSSFGTVIITVMYTFRTHFCCWFQAFVCHTYLYELYSVMWSVLCAWVIQGVCVCEHAECQGRRWWLGLLNLTSPSLLVSLALASALW